ncbi:hypothetical protein ACOJBO_08155 [Rhizobium beringeri]
MNVVTSKRVYTFFLNGAKPGNTKTAVIKLRFSYPEDLAGRQSAGRFPPERGHAYVRAA